MFQYIISKLDEIIPCFQALNESMGGFNGETAYAVRLVLDELSANVIKHSKCKAVITAEERNGVLTLFIRGECEFCPQRIRPITLEEESGRGVFLVRGMCKAFRYEEGGRLAIAEIMLGE